jgi:hypothetical protein
MTEQNQLAARAAAPSPAEIATEIAALPQLNVRQLRDRYAEAFGEPTRATNKAWLVKRLAWRLQAGAGGGLSERAARRAAELANAADLRLSPPPRASTPQAPLPIVSRSDRLPPPGTVLTRTYKGRQLTVQSLVDGFEFEGQLYRSLSAIAKTITGSHCSGWLFFKLARRKEKS